jgi:RNA polymerase sigma-70 factor (ECF subfamily)
MASVDPDLDLRAAADAALVRDALAGDPGARERLATGLVQVLRILSVLNARAGGRLPATDVEDLAQDTLVRVWQKIATFQGQTTLAAWLFRFCYLEYQNRIRTRSRAPRMDAADVAALARARVEDPTDERVEWLERLVEELAPPDAEVLRLKHFEELSFTAIAERLGIPPSTVKTRYYRGLEQIERRLARVRAETQP